MRERIHAAAMVMAGLFALAGCGPGSEEDEREAEHAAPAVAAADDGTTVVLVGYYSLSGQTKRLSLAVVEGARGVEGVQAVRKPVAEITPDDLARADGLVLGGPTHYANVPGEMMSTLSDWVWKDGTNLQDKVGGAFATGGHDTGGKEHVVISLLLYMLNNRMIVVGPILQPGEKGYGELGATATTSGDDAEMSDAELEGARRLGERVATVARRASK